MYITHQEYIKSLPKEDQEEIERMTNELRKEVTLRFFRWTLNKVPKPSMKMTKAEENGDVEYLRVINIADLEKHAKKIGGELELVVKLPNKKRIKVRRAESKPLAKTTAKKTGQSKPAVKSASVVSATPTVGKKNFS